MKNFNNETKRKIIEKYLQQEYDDIFNVAVGCVNDIFVARFNENVTNYYFEIRFSKFPCGFIVNTRDKSVLGADVIEINKIVQDLKIIFKTLETIEDLY